jgi:thiol-disulfide isomerase/thioredoxin
MLTLVFLIAAASEGGPHCTPPEKPVKLAWAKQELGAAADKPLWINVWGTFCPPCVEELPRLPALARALGVTLVLISLDSQAKFVAYTRAHPTPEGVFSLTNTRADKTERLAGVLDLDHAQSFPQQLFFDREHSLHCTVFGTIQDTDLATLRRALP